MKSAHNGETVEKKRPTIWNTNPINNSLIQWFVMLNWCYHQHIQRMETNVIQSFFLNDE